MKYILLLFVLSLAACEKDPVDNNNNNNPVDSTYYTYSGRLVIELPGQIDTADNVIAEVITTSQDSIFITQTTPNSTQTHIRGTLVGDSINIPLQSSIDGYGRITESTLDYTLNVHVGSNIVYPRTYTGTAQ